MKPNKPKIKLKKYVARAIFEKQYSAEDERGAKEKLFFEIFEKTKDSFNRWALMEILKVVEAKEKDALEDLVEKKMEKIKKEKGKEK